MSALETQVDAILGDPLRAARGGGALGYVGLDVPPDLLFAFGGPSCHLPWRLDVETRVAAQWLENSFPAWAFSMVEDWAAGRFDCFERVIFSRGDDASHRLYYYICELQRRGRISGPRPLVFDVARIPRESSRRHTELALRKLLDELAIDNERLAEGVQRTNELRNLFGLLQMTRRGSGHLYEKIVRASLFADVAPLLEGWSAPRGDDAFGTVLLLGSSPPDDRLHRAVEGCGWTVVDELYDRSLRRLGPQVEIDGTDLNAAVVRQWLSHSFGKRDFTDPVLSEAGAIGGRKADAAILWLTREDEGLAWRAPAQRAALEAAGLPTLALTARSWSRDDGAVEAIQTFLRGLR
jgi:hypothetical protein